jgi:MYXO-CTERM domain-containing protein
MNTKLILPLAGAIVALGLSGSRAFAAAAATDAAPNYSSWSASTTPNLGSGFGAWSVLDNDGGGSAPYAGTYLDLASYNNAGSVNGGLSAWGIYANGGSGNAFIDLTRAFSPGGSGSANLFNQTFSFAIGSGGVGGTGQSIAANIGTAFSLAYTGGGADNFTLSVDGGAANPLSPAVNQAAFTAGLTVALTVSGPLNSTTEGYTLSISPFAGGPAIFSTSGTFNSAAYNTSSLTFADNNTANNSYLNDLNITAEAVPEPSSILLGLSGLAALLAIRRRK